MYDTTLYFSGRLDFITFGFFKSHKAPCWTPSYIDIDLSYNSAAAGSDHKSAQILKSKEKFCFLRWFTFSVLRSDTFISFLNFEQFPETKTAAAALGAGVSSHLKIENILSDENQNCKIVINVTFYNQYVVKCEQKSEILQL